MINHDQCLICMHKPIHLDRLGVHLYGRAANFAIESTDFVWSSTGWMDACMPHLVDHPEEWAILDVS